MKKIIVKTFGVLSSIALPLVAITSCGSTVKQTNNTNSPTVNDSNNKGSSDNQNNKPTNNKPAKDVIKKTWSYPKITDQGSREIVNKWINPFIASKAKKYIENKKSVFGDENSFKYELEYTLKKKVLENYEINKKQKFSNAFKALFLYGFVPNEIAKQVYDLYASNEEFKKECDYFTGGDGENSETTIKHFGSLWTSVSVDKNDFVSGIGLGNAHHLWESNNMETIKSTTIWVGTFNINKGLAFDMFKAKKMFLKFSSKWNLPSNNVNWGKEHYETYAKFTHKKDASVNWTDLYDDYMLHKSSKTQE